MKFHRKSFKNGIGKKTSDFGDQFYLSEIEAQCEFGLRAFGEMQAAYKADKTHSSLLAMSHMLLVFAGNVAKLLTTGPRSPRKAKDRADRLSKLLEVENEDFSKIRSARNYFEHFDERMDKYIGNTQGLMIHRTILGHFPEKIELDDGRYYQPKFMQFLDTEKIELTLYDEKFTLTPIVELLQVIQKKAKEKLKTYENPNKAG